MSERNIRRQWDAIRTAPRDGRTVFLFSSYHGKAVIRGRFMPGVGWVNSSGFKLLWRPTHWIPVDALRHAGAAA